MNEQQLMIELTPDRVNDLRILLDATTECKPRLQSNLVLIFEVNGDAQAVSFSYHTIPERAVTKSVAPGAYIHEPEEK